MQKQVLHAADRRIAAERRGRRLAPEDALAIALELMLLYEERGPPRPDRDPSEEDRRVHEAWARLRRRWTRSDD